MSKICPSDKILNIKTNRCVLKTGNIGKKILKEPKEPKTKEPKTKEPKEPKTKVPKEPKTKEPKEPKTKVPKETKTKVPKEPKTKVPKEPKTKVPKEPNLPKGCIEFLKLFDKKINTAIGEKIVISELFDKNKIRIRIKYIEKYYKNQATTLVKDRNTITLYFNNNNNVYNIEIIEGNKWTNKLQYTVMKKEYYDANYKDKYSELQKIIKILQRDTFLLLTGKRYNAYNTITKTNNYLTLDDIIHYYKTNTNTSILLNNGTNVHIYMKDYDVIYNIKIDATFYYLNTMTKTYYDNNYNYHNKHKVPTPPPAPIKKLLSSSTKIKKFNISYNFNKETNYFDVLGVNKYDATENEIKKNYRSLTMKVHPDKTNKYDDDLRKYAEEKFKIINQANEILSDKNKREYYIKNKKSGWSNEDILKYITIYKI